VVAEAIPEQAVEQAQGQVPEPSESIPEQEAAPEPEEDYSSILDQLVPDEPATGDTKDGDALAGGGETSLEGLTPQQILELGKKQGKDETVNALTEQTRTTQERNREQGLRNVLAMSKTDVQQELTTAGVDTETALRILQKLDQVHGAHYAIKDADIKAATENTVTAMQNSIAAAGQKFLGDKDFNPVGMGMDGFIDKIAEHARKGYKSPSEVKDERRQAQVSLLKSLKAAGVEIPSGTLNLPSDAKAAVGGRRISTSYDNDTAFNEGRITREQWKANDDRFREQGRN